MAGIKIGTTIPLGHLRTVNVRVVKIMDGQMSEVASYSAFRMDRLEEWWFVPDGQFAWGGSDISAAGCRDLNQLMLKLQGDEMYQQVLRKIQSHICAATPPQRSVSDLRWRLATRLIDNVGSVISIICGEKAALEGFDERRHSMRVNAWG